MVGTSDLADVLAAIKEVTKPYELGIQLKIDSSELDSIEKNHPRDNDRQKIEVVKYWLRNSPDASWTTLANAVERMGGHARLVGRLREKGQRIIGDLAKLVERFKEMKFEKETEVYSHEDSLDTCLQCSVLLLGKMGHGKSTLANRILNCSG